MPVASGLRTCRGPCELRLPLAKFAPTRNGNRHYRCNCCRAEWEDTPNGKATKQSYWSRRGRFIRLAKRGLMTMPINKWWITP